MNLSQLKLRLGSAFSNLPNLQSLTCTALTESKYRLKSSHDRLRRIVHDTLVQPNFNACFYVDEHPIIARLPAAALHAMLGYTARAPVSIDFRMLPWNFLDLLPRYTVNSLPASRVSALQTFRISLFSSGGNERRFQSRAIDRISLILNLASNIKHLSWSINAESIRGPFRDLAAVLPMPQQFSVGSLKSLQSLELLRATITRDSFVGFLRESATNKQLQSLSLKHVFLQGGRWVDTFPLFRTLALSNTSINLEGKLLEVNCPDGPDMNWVKVCYCNYGEENGSDDRDTTIETDIKDESENKSVKPKEYHNDSGCDWDKYINNSTEKHCL